MGDLTAEHHKQNYLSNCHDATEITFGRSSVTLGYLEKIDEDADEVWLLQCPKGMDLTQLTEHKLKLPGRSHTDAFDIIASERELQPRETAATFGFCTKRSGYALGKFPIRGNIVVRERLLADNPPSFEQDAEEQSEEQQQLPGLVKVRHPLLGAKFKKLVELPHQIADRLKEADETSSQVLLQLKHQERNRKAQRPAKSSAPFKKALSVINLDSDEEMPPPAAVTSKRKSRKELSRAPSVINLDSDYEAAADQTSSKKKRKTRPQSDQSDDASTVESTPSKKKRKKATSILNDVPEGLKWVANI